MPVEPAALGHAPTEESEDDDSDQDDDESGFSLVHVPIKRKGSRKR